MSGTNGHRAERDGCGCPPWVRCVHFAGQVLWLVDRRKQAKDPDIVACSKPKGSGYGIGLGTKTRLCDVCGQHLVLWLGPEGATTEDTLRAAENEFDRRAEELRSRDPE